MLNDKMYGTIQKHTIYNLMLFAFKNTTLWYSMMQHNSSKHSIYTFL